MNQLSRSSSFPIILRKLFFISDVYPKERGCLRRRPFWAQYVVDGLKVKASVLTFCESTSAYLIAKRENGWGFVGQFAEA
jgi:hypothetical protein